MNVLVTPLRYDFELLLDMPVTHSSVFIATFPKFKDQREMFNEFPKKMTARFRSRLRAVRVIPAKHGGTQGMQSDDGHGSIGLTR